MHAATVLLVLSLACGRAWGQSPPPVLDPATKEVLLNYLKDPDGGRRAVLRLAAHGTDGLPTPVLMALADAQLRSGRSGSARRLYEAVLAQNPGPPTAGWAEIGLGWAALARGDLETARAHYAQAPEDGGSAGLAAMMTGMIDAATGDPAAVAGRLEQMVADPATPPRLASMLGLIAGYARYWSGDYEGAAKAFAAVAAADPEGPAADDARFAAARVQAALGDREGARAALREMSDAAKRPGPGGPVGGGLIDLDPRAMLRASVRRYRHSSLSQVLDAVSLLDGDGRVLAGTALRRRTWGNASPPGGPATAHAPSAAPAGARLPAAGTATVRGEARETGAARGESASSHPRRTWLALAAGLVAILLALVLRRRTAA